METNQKIQQILQAIQLNEQIPNPSFAGQYLFEPVIKGEDRAALIAELVKLLTAE